MSHQTVTEKRARRLAKAILTLSHAESHVRNTAEKSDDSFSGLVTSYLGLSELRAARMHLISSATPTVVKLALEFVTDPEAVSWTQASKVWAYREEKHKSAGLAWVRGYAYAKEEKNND